MHEGKCLMCNKHKKSEEILDNQVNLIFHINKINEFVCDTCVKKLVGQAIYEDYRGAILIDILVKYLHMQRKLKKEKIICKAMAKMHHVWRDWYAKRM